MVATLRVTSRFHSASNLTMRTLAAALAAALVGWLLHSTPCATSSGGQAPSPVHMNGNERTGEAPVFHWKNDDVTVAPQRNLFAFVENTVPVRREANDPRSFAALRIKLIDRPVTGQVV